MELSLLTCWTLLFAFHPILSTPIKILHPFEEKPKSSLYSPDVHYTAFRQEGYFAAAEDHRNLKININPNSTLKAFAFVEHMLASTQNREIKIDFEHLIATEAIAKTSRTFSSDFLDQRDLLFDKLHFYFGAFEENSVEDEPTDSIMSLSPPKGLPKIYQRFLREASKSATKHKGDAKRDTDKIEEEVVKVEESAIVSSAVSIRFSSKIDITKDAKQMDQHAYNVKSFSSQLLDDVKENLHNEPGSFQTELFGISDLLEMLTDTWTSLAVASESNRLPESLLTDLEFEPIIEHVKAVLEKYGQQTWLTNLGDFNLLKSNYKFTKEGLNINIEVPFFVSNRLMTLYKYIPLPTPLHPDPNETARLAIHITSDHNYIAVDGNNEFYILMDEYQFGECRDLKGFLICPDHSYTHRGLENTCLGSLFIHSGDGVNGNCEQKIYPYITNIVDTMNYHYLILSSTEIKTELSCGDNKTEYLIPAQRQVQVNIPPGCSMPVNEDTLTGHQTSHKVVVKKFHSLELTHNGLKDRKLLRERDSLFKKYLEEKRKSTKINWNLATDNDLPTDQFYLISGVVSGLIMILLIICICMTIHCKRIK